MVPADRKAAAHKDLRNVPSFVTISTVRTACHSVEKKGDKIIADVRVVGNRSIDSNTVLQQLQCKKGRFYSREILLSDIHRLNEMRSFERVTFKTEETPSGVIVSFIVSERPLVTEVVYHGRRRMNERDLKGRSGLVAGDPLSEFSVESARRRLIDYYRDEGFGQVSITSFINYENKPGLVLFRINEGPKERINKISMEGNSILSDARLKKIIKSRDALFWGPGKYAFNVASLPKINQDVDILAATYRNLGYLTPWSVAASNMTKVVPSWMSPL